MKCDHADCGEEAIAGCRFGDGTWSTSSWKTSRDTVSASHEQTFVHYCELHLREVGRLFRLCDIRPTRRGAKHVPRGPNLRAPRAATTRRELTRE